MDVSDIIILYTALAAVLAPAVVLAFVWRYGLRRTLSGLPERLGMGAGPGGRMFAGGWLWIHAASVGEVKAAEALLRAVPDRFPGVGRLLTTTTVTGKELAEKNGLAECVRLAPADLPWCVGRLLDRWRPRAAVLVETELWPNWIRGLDRRGVPTVVVNGRVSDRSYPRYLALRRFWAPLLVRLDRVGAQSHGHADRFLKLGVDPSRVVVTGNLKFDVPLPDSSRRSAVKSSFGFSPTDVVWACGSTHAGEEEVLSDVLLRLRASGLGLKMIMAPRHVERALPVARMLAAKGLSVRLRSLRVSAEGPEAAVLILDTMGELSEAYGAAAFAFVGGSLIPRGGQNPLEPARWAIPVLFGPHMENFREMAERFLAEGAAVQISDGAVLEKEASSLLKNASRASALGEAARRVAESQRGAVEKSLALVAEALGRASRSRA
jgi:3-deoxy-D-manno-octulosonic-acid transferase